MPKSIKTASWHARRSASETCPVGYDAVEVRNKTEAQTERGADGPGGVPALVPLYVGLTQGSATPGTVTSGTLGISGISVQNI